MGLSCMPTPKDNLMAYVLYNTAVSMAIVAGLVRSALVFLGIAVPHPWEEGEEHQLAAIAAAAGPTLADRFRSRFRPSRFGRRRGGAGAGAADCRVCLARFEPESVVNRLPCGHLFHRVCLETWLDYNHATCPLCRTRLLPAASADESSPSPPPRPDLRGVSLGRPSCPPKTHSQPRRQIGVPFCSPPHPRARSSRHRERHGA